MSKKLTKLWLTLAAVMLGCVFAPAASAQGGPINSIALRYTPSGVQYFPGATITICASNATIPLNGVCTPAENDANCCFTNAAMTVASPNPTAADTFANYPPLFGTPGNYIVCISGNNATPRCSPYVIPCVPSAVVAGCATNAGIARLQISGTPLVSGDFSTPSAGGWGTGATISSIAGSDSGFQFTITAGTSPSIAPTITLTFHDGPWTAINSVSANWIAGTGNVADVQQSNNLSSITLTYLDLPVATKTYTFSVLLSGRSNVIPVTSVVNPVVLNPSGFQTITGFGLGVPSLTSTGLSTFNAGITGTGNIGNLDLGSAALGASHTWSAAQTFPASSIACTVLIGGCPSGGTTVSINGVSQGSAVNLGALPSADANNVQVVWKQGSGKGSGEVPGSGNGSQVCTVAGSMSGGHLVAIDANGNCIDSGFPIQNHYTLASDVSVSAATITTLKSATITMPSTGCPCRADVRWEFGATTSNAGGVEAWVSDGTNNFAPGGANTTGSVGPPTQFHAKGGEYSLGTAYANGANVTFTWKVESEQAITVRQSSQFAPVGAYLDITIYPSN